MQYNEKLSFLKTKNHIYKLHLEKYNKGTKYNLNKIQDTPNTVSINHINTLTICRQ